MFMKSATPKSAPSGLGLLTIGLAAATIAGTSASYSADIVISVPQSFTETLFEDSTVTVTRTGSITIAPGTVAIDAATFNSEITLFGPVSATSDTPGDVVNTILQNGPDYNILTVRRGGDIFAGDAGTAAAVLRGVDQFGLFADNSISLEEASITVTSTSAESFGIRQLSIAGDHSIQFGSNGRISVTGGFTAQGITQNPLGGSAANVFGANTRIDANALTGNATAITQSAVNDTTNMFGVNARINARGTIDAIGIEQNPTLGHAITTFGSGAQINITAGNNSDGILQNSADNRFLFGANSTMNVVAGNDGVGLRQTPFGPDSTASAIMQANSRISVIAGGTATGITSSAGPGSLITLEQGAEIYASGDRASGIVVTGDGYNLQNNGGRIIATSTNATQASFGVSMVLGDNTFVNHGTVFADLAAGSHAILMSGDNNMLSLLTYPVIQGQITFGNGSGTFGTGNTLLMGRGFDAAFTVGADPAGLTVLGQGQSLTVSQIGINLLKVVSIDSDGFFRASSVRMADDLIRFLQQEITTHALKNRTFLYQDNGLIQDFWFDASGFGQHSTTGRAYSHALGAFTIGYDRAFEGNGLGGVYAGYSVGSVNQGNQHWDNTLQTAYAGIYYDRAFDRILTGINLLAGINWDDVSRTYLDNTVPGGIVNGSDNGVGFLISPELTVGYELPWRQYLFVPSVGVRYSLFHQDSYSEGGANGLSLSNRNHQQINVRLQVAGIGLSAVNQDATRWNTTLRGGLDIYGNWGDDIDASVMGFDVIYDENLNDGGVRPFIGADVEYLVTDRASLDFGVEGAYDSINAVFGSINAGFSVLF